MKKSVICVTQKSLVQDNFLQRMEKIIEIKPYAVILREKELSPQNYAKLTEKINPLCQRQQVNLFLNTEINLAIELANKYNCHIQTSFNNFLAQKNLPEKIKLGISIHSIQEAKFIASCLEQNNQISHVLAGHIFATDCKAGLAPRGLDFLKNVVKALKIPVFGIGGINPINWPEVQKTGAGAALMSSLMTCQDPKNLLEYF